MARVVRSTHVTCERSQGMHRAQGKVGLWASGAGTLVEAVTSRGTHPERARTYRALSTETVSDIALHGARNQDFSPPKAERVWGVVYQKRGTHSCAAQNVRRGLRTFLMMPTKTSMFPTRNHTHIRDRPDNDDSETSGTAPSFPPMLGSSAPDPCPAKGLSESVSSRSSRPQRFGMDPIDAGTRRTRQLPVLLQRPGRPGGV